MADYLGSLIVEQGQQWGWDSQVGQTLIRTWKGEKDYATAYFNTLQNQSGVLRTRLSPDGEGAVWVVTAEYGQIQEQAETDGTIPYFWELAGNMIDRSTLDHPKFYSGNAIDTGATPPIYMTFSQVTDVKQAIQDNLTGATLQTKYDGWTETQRFLWSELVRGNDTYQVSSWALRINRTFSSLYSNTIPTTDVGKLYAYAQIQAEASSVSSLIPTAIDSNVPSDGYWLKQAPVLTELSNRKLQLNQEWWWSDNWSQVIYDLKS